jgi:hypothetical protein
LVFSVQNILKKQNIVTYTKNHLFVLKSLFVKKYSFTGGKTSNGMC